MQDKSPARPQRASTDRDAGVRLRRLAAQLREQADRLDAHADAAFRRAARTVQS